MMQYKTKQDTEDFTSGSSVSGATGFSFGVEENTLLETGLRKEKLRGRLTIPNRRAIQAMTNSPKYAAQ